MDNQAQTQTNLMDATARNLLDFHAKPEGYYSGERKDMLRYIPPTTRCMLEVGCAEGVFSLRLKQDRGMEAWGIEMNQAAAQAAASKLDRVIEGRAEEVLHELPDGYFDCVICNDVLEHMYDPYSFLARLKAKLSPQGVIVCSIPNIRYYKILYQIIFQRQWRYEDSGVLDKTHVRFFTRESIREFLTDLDFRILTLEGLRPTRKVKIRLLSWLTFGWLSDIQSWEFACVITPAPSGPGYSHGTG